ncbi:putative phosphatidylinositol-specific phospholipase C, X domain-containing protein [Rosa chinensis]|uniref:Putative phosphatidylinositol-specific phospholipase C, X domain-containing protein n=1 Tax=Rosa chinensis TaxID=74649 RepID=A0A2P6Q9U5_ROSCH|nr:uncharacterized protein LOC112202016 [Rosa chinensis]PRQ30941.1 putative phosphatidylinositol-specific phospholipase C, X domain-containing protein [Rosa chinensis]
MSLFRSLLSHSSLLKPQNPLFISQTTHHPLSFSSIFLRTLSSLEPKNQTKPRKPLDLVFKKAVGLSPEPETSDTETDDDPLKQSLRELEQELKGVKSNPNVAQIEPRRRETQNSKADREQPKNPKKGISLYAVFTNKTVDGETGNEMTRERSDVCKELSPEMELVVSYLYKEGYFSNANFLSLYEDRLDFSCFDNSYGRGFIKYAVEKFANDKQQIAKWLSGSDLKKVALFGCPSLAKKSVFGAKRLRKFFEIPEETVCSKCVLRESCRFVNKSVWRGATKNLNPTNNVGKGNPKNLNLADVMNIIMLYALESVPPQLVVPDHLKASVSRLLKEILKLSQTTS